MDKETLIALLDRFQNGTCTGEERKMVEQLYLDLSENRVLPEMQDILLVYDRTWQVLKQEEAASQPSLYRRLKPRKVIAAAAAIAGLAIISSVAYYTYVRVHPAATPASLVQDIAPGGNKATLTLSTGQQIILDSTKSGDIVQMPGITIKKTKEGKLIYTISKNSSSTAAPDQVNTVATPKGGQYEIVLEDGTKVWLNAASKITFPASFNGLKERQVELSGEAYFEVTKNPRKPFFVRSTEQLVTVTGTHFNVSCYPDEKTQTTLAEGSVEVSLSRTGQTKTLTPGKQSTIMKDEISIKDVDPADIIAWKDGVFIFNGTPMTQVMKQIGRWYNVDIDYSTLPDTELVGEFPRNLSLSQVLKLIEISSMVKLSIEGRRITAQH
jgi:ferric-dicitrate binding protein FerR (iron transport regulator)